MSGVVPGAASACLVDGRPGESISALDRGFHYGDGVFETMTVRRGHVRFYALHLERLRRGCARLGLAAPPDRVLRDEVFALAANAEAAIVKLLVTRGVGAARGYDPRYCTAPMRVVLRYPWPQPPARGVSAGARLAWSVVPASEQPMLAGLKHLNRLDSVLARGLLDHEAYDEALLCDHAGYVVGGSMSNVFIVRSGELQTPACERAGVAGIMRAVVLREARRRGIATQEANLSAADICDSDEIFLTNVRIGIWPVTLIAQGPGASATRSLAAGTLTGDLQRHCAQLLD
jgi:4-amino-4-deoxychorismate lyase